MIAYIARDKNGSLWLHTKKPELAEELDGYYSDDFFQINDEMFPELKNITFSDSPVKVEFNIKRV